MQELVDGQVVLNFSSSDIPASQWMEVVHDCYGMTAARMQIDAYGEQKPVIELNALVLDGAVVGEGLLGGLKSVRSKQLVADDGNDNILLLSSTSHAYGRFPGEREATAMEAGELLVTTFGGPAFIHQPMPARVSSIQMSREKLRSLVPRFDPDVTLRPGRDVAPAGLLFRYANLLRTTGLSDPDLQRTATSHLFDLAALVLGATGDYAEQARERGVRAARLASIKASLRARFDDPELSVAAIAHGHGISVRYLQTLFEQEGTTCSAFLTGLRMEFAASRLRNPACRHLRVADIAFDAGFSDLTAFNRTFRRHFGETPSRMRAG